LGISDPYNSKFPVLSNQIKAVFEIIRKEINKKKLDRALVVGIAGIDASGKTIFTDLLGKFLSSKGYAAQIVNLDDFHNPKHVRNSGSNQSENYFTKGFDIETLVTKLLKPVHEQGEAVIHLTLLDLMTDRYSVKKQFSINRDTVVLLEGVFLFRKELSPFIDLKIFLAVPFEESKRRAGTRDIPKFGPEIMTRYDEKYFPAQRRYLNDYPPETTADIVIDNTNWEYPEIVNNPPASWGASRTTKHF
jgi:uridine kinase